MPTPHPALAGTATDLFAGIPVRDFPTSLDWYIRLLGAPPTFLPNDREAVWSLADHRWLYIIVDEKRAGGAIQTIMCADLDATLAAIAQRGLTFDAEERPAPDARKVMFHDPDGNELSLGTIPSD